MHGMKNVKYESHYSDTQHTEAAEVQHIHDEAHFPNDFSLSSWKKYVVPAALYLLITLIVFWPVVIHPATTVAAGRPGASVAGTADLYQNLWSMWWVNYAVFNLHASPYYTKLLFYPLGASLVTETLEPLSTIFSYPFQAVSIAFAYNVVMFVDFVLSGLFTFMLADYVIKNKYAAFIAGTIFAFSAFHMAHAMEGQINWIGIEFFPLFILSLILMIKERKLRYVPLTSVSYVLLAFFGDPEQAIMGMIAAALIVIMYAIGSDRGKYVLNRRFVLYAAGAMALSLVISSPFLIPIAKGILNGGALGLANGSSSIGNNMVWSGPLLSFVLPSPVNGLFSPISKGYFSIYNYVGNEDRIVYIGWTAIILSIIGILGDMRRNRMRNSYMWIALGAVSALLIVGPYLQIGAIQKSISASIPGIYLLYRHIPILNLVREPGRFDLILTLCVALLAGLGIKELGHKFGSNNRAMAYIAATIAILFIIESAGIPITGGYISTHFLRPSIPNVYTKIAAEQGNFSVVVLPILPSVSNLPQIYTGESMYYQTAFHKPLVGGFTTRENASDQYIRLNMPLSVQAASLQAGGLFTYASPFNENYTNLTVFFLSKYNVRYVSVINSAYNLTDALVINDYMDSAFGKPVYRDNSTSIWSVSNTVNVHAGRSIVSYISQGNWSYGCSQLGRIECTANLSSLWYGPDLRAINVSVPANDTHVHMTFSAASLNGNVVLHLFQTSDKHLLGAAELNRNVTTFGLDLSLNPGTTALFFVATNSTAQGPNSAYDFGIRNITFTPVNSIG